MESSLSGVSEDIDVTREQAQSIINSYRGDSQAKSEKDSSSNISSFEVAKTNGYRYILFQGFFLTTYD